VSVLFFIFQSLNNFTSKLPEMSDNLIGQIEEEKLVMELFRQEYDDFPKGKLVKSESPDLF
jgi:hypothetical protein